MKKQIFKIILFFTLCVFVIPTIKSQVWSWAKSGQCSSGWGGGVCADGSSGNVFATGSFSGSTLVLDTYTLTNTGGFKLFLVKYDINGNVIWVRTSNGTVGNESGKSVCTDNNGNVYVSGQFSNPTIAFGTFTLTKVGTSSGFLTKYDSNGNVLWAKVFRAAAVTPERINVDNAGNTFVAGNFNGTTCTFDSFTISTSGCQNTFLAKYDDNGNVLWARGSIGSTCDNGFSVSTDAIGNAYLSGYFSSPTISFGTYTLTNSGASGSAFIVKYDPNGNEIWARCPNSVLFGDSQGYSISCEPGGNTYLTGPFSGTLAFGSYTLTGFNNWYLAKYDMNGNVLWATNPNINNFYNETNAFSVSTDGNSIYLSGGFNDTLVIGSYTLIAQPGATYPMFIARYDLNGNLVFATSLTNGGGWPINGNCVDDFCNTYNTGNIRGTPTNFVIGTTTLTQTGASNPYISKLSFNCLIQELNEESLDKNKILIFPNPNRGAFKLQILDKIKNGEISLINAIGQKVFEQKVIPGSNEIIANELPSGIYYCILIQERQQIGCVKISIE